MPNTPKLRHSMPRSIYDVTAANNPDLAAHAKEVASRNEGGDYVIPFEDYPWNPNILEAATRRSMRRQESPHFFHDQTLFEAYFVASAWAEWQIANLLIHGLQTFYIHENIVPLLATTHINLDADSFVLPAPACLFVFDDDETRQLAYAGAPDPELMSKKVPISVALFREKSKSPEGIADITILAEHGDEMRSFCTWKRRVVLREGMTLDQSLRKPFTDEEMAAINREAGVDPGPNDDAYFTESDFQGKDFDFIRMVMNTALYLTSNGADLSERVDPPRRGQFATLPKAQRQRLETAAAANSKLSYIYVGRNVEPVEVERDEYEAGDGRKLTKRFKVRAHKRWQRVGAGRLEIRLTDVKPHWKGPEAAEVLHRRTVLKLHPDAMQDVPDADETPPAPGM